MNQKGQAQSIIIFVGIVLVTFVVGLIVLKAVNSILTPFSAGVGNVTSSAGSAVSKINTSFTSMWDWVIMIIFAINVILLLVSSFLVDVHPAFLFIYILAVFFLIVFSASIIGAVEDIWGRADFSEQAGNLQMSTWIVSNFSFVLLGIIILSGVVMYSKIKYFSGAGSGGY